MLILLLSCCTVCQWGPCRRFGGEPAALICKSECSKRRNSLRCVGSLTLKLTVMGAGSEARSGAKGAVKNKRDKNKGGLEPQNIWCEVTFFHDVAT